MNEAVPFFLIDPTIDPDDQERIAYLQDVFISRTILRQPLFMCDGPIEAKEGKCEHCQAPTLDTPHAYKPDILSFSSSFDVLPDLMKVVLCEWTLHDIRLLGTILRLDDPLVVAQDIIHVYQKRHPWGITSDNRALQWRMKNIAYDFVRSLAPDVYFVPCRHSGWLSEKYTAQLVIGHVTALVQLSLKARRLGHVNFDDQWVCFEAEHVPLLTEHPEWNVEWIAAWDAYMHEMKRQDQEDQEDRENYLGTI
ncbi:MAG: hypothetical protein H0V70_08790 [Ktedonobacteraceae bacterium]|nr:hypothetical protein [Ktedonobacteraceae bacterium]